MVDAQFQPPPRAGVEETGFDVVTVGVEVEFDCVPVVEDISPRPINGFVGRGVCRVSGCTSRGRRLLRRTGRRQDHPVHRFPGLKDLAG